MKKIGLFGGTFDPPHIGHLIIAEEVRMALQLDEVWFIPTNDPPHKSSARAEGEDRFKMLNLAINDHSFFKSLDIELKRQGKSYTIETVQLLKRAHPLNSFYFIIGADLIETLDNWKDINKLINLVTFVGVNRSGYSIKTSYPVTFVKIPFIDVSSTMIRNRLANKQSVKFWLPPSVYRYILKERLYEIE